MEKTTVERLFDECYEISSKGLGSSYGLGIEKVNGGYAVKIYPHRAVGTNLVDALTELKKILLWQADKELADELARSERNLKSYNEDILNCNAKIAELNSLKEQFMTRS